MRRPRPLLPPIYRLYEHSGFAMAGAVAFSFVVSLFEAIDAHSGTRPDWEI